MTTDHELAARPGNGKGHVLLISPLTFSYHVSICAALRDLGYGVTWWDERASSSTWYKLALRLFPDLTARWSEPFFLQRLAQLDCAEISHVLVIKGEGMSQRVVNAIRNACSQASMGFYLWDGVDNVKGVTDILSAFDSVATFDPVDAQNFGWVYRPLFGRNIAVAGPARQPTQFDWCFIGTIHSDRHRVIDRLRRRHGSQYRHFVYCYFQSPLIYFIRLLTDTTLWRAPKTTLTTVAMAAEEVAGILERCRAVVDVEHPRQRGFTMRTIETLLAGKKLVTTNEFITGCNLFHPSRVHLISREQPEIPLEFLEQPFLEIPAAIRSYYSTQSWIVELLALQDAARLRRLAGTQ